MIPSRYEYYRKRAQEHRALANSTPELERRSMHDRLCDAYMGLARQSRRRQVVSLKV